MLTSMEISRSIRDIRSNNTNNASCNLICHLQTSNLTTNSILALSLNFRIEYSVEPQLLRAVTGAAGLLGSIFLR